MNFPKKSWHLFQAYLVMKAIQAVILRRLFWSLHLNTIKGWNSWLMVLCSPLILGIPTSCNALIWWKSATNHFDTKTSWQHVHCISLCRICFSYSQQAYYTGKSCWTYFTDWFLHLTSGSCISSLCYSIYVGRPTRHIVLIWKWFNCNNVLIAISWWPKSLQPL